MKKRIKLVLWRLLNFIIIPIHQLYKKKRSVQSVAFEKSPELKDDDMAYDFDEAYYLKLYPDIATANINPYFHFVSYGKAEGRRGSPYNLYKELVPFNDLKETILVVSHEASRTGAPILALNIARELKAQFNVVVLLLHGGDITSFFEQTCNVVISIDRSILPDTVFMDALITQLIQRYEIKYSIVNSIESFWVLEPLAKYFIPTVQLIHEFASYITPKTKLADTFLWAGTIVFPAEIVQKNALNQYNVDAMRLTHVLPQGQSEIPSEPDEENNNFIMEAITSGNKKEIQSKPFIVLGAGSINYRKGVDLFIATAAELKRAYSECNIMFMWVGAGYNPEQDCNYSCYLSEQINRSDLKDFFQFIDALPSLDALYKQVDVFYLSSRLDPLPNVAIDAMMYEKPLICFDKATGIAEILQLDADTAECVIPYLSVAESTKKIVQLYQSPEYYALIAKKVKKIALNKFNMKEYVSKLVNLIENQKDLLKQEEMDYKTLKESNEFNSDFFLHEGNDRIDPIRRYVRAWYSKVSPLRKPVPGFNPTIYSLLNCQQEKHAEPFVHYLRKGKPKGPWQETVIAPNHFVAKNKTTLRCAVHIHVFYPDILPYILKRIQSNQHRYDLYISTSQPLLHQVSQIVSDYKQINAKISVVPNKGRDLGPFLSEFDVELQKYDVVGHFHTKKSLDLNNTKLGQEWYHFLIANLIGNQHRMADQILNEFHKDPRLGLVFADDPYVLDWGKNRTIAEVLTAQLNTTNLPDNQFNFPAGTMFWVRPQAIKPLFDLHYSWDMYPEEPLPYDGSILHAIERLIPIIIANEGFKQAVTHIPGLTR